MTVLEREVLDAAEVYCSGDILAYDRLRKAVLAVRREKEGCDCRALRQALLDCTRELESCWISLGQREPNKYVVAARKMLDV